ncbi:hypothetical protein H3C61_03305 [Candidatus Gracilibacteria bacterium]|nr:hypothetical protein [Candidatus Gracilibacteria bacterium]
MDKNIKNEGFFLVLVIIIIFILGLFSLIIYNITNLDLRFIDSQSQNLKGYQKYTNTKNITSKFHTITNTDGLQKDLTSCSGGLLDYQFKKIPTCEGGEIVDIKDDIDDLGDNDDFKASFYTGGINSLVTTNSILYDNDDFSRKYLIGIIPPLEEKTILFLNDELKETISLNSNNNSFYQNTPLSIGSIDSGLKIKGELNNLNGEIEIYKFDKDIFNSKKDLQYISSVKGEIKSSSGFLSISGSIDNQSMPYLFAINDFDYAIVVKNNSQTDVLVYKFIGYNKENKEVYIVGINDKNGFKDNIFYFPELIKNYYGYVIKYFK